MKKKLVSLLSAVVLSISVLPISAFANSIEDTNDDSTSSEVFS